MNINSLRASHILLENRFIAKLGALIQRIGFTAFIVLSLCFVQQIHAQGTNIQGTVTDAQDGNSLPGVNVVVKGMPSRGTATNADGQYSLAVPTDMDTLIFSFVGYQTQEIPIQGRNILDVALSPNVQMLENVVVVGYGVESKKDATGAVLAVTSDDFNQGIFSTPEQLLQGRASGIQITPASGEPGASTNIRIRGTSSIRSNDNPLFVVDGVPLSGSDVTPGGSDFGVGTQSAINPLSFLNPDDIESISVLKDASAAAIYGSRGANGVVLITTKKGTPGGTGSTISVTSKASVSRVREKIDLVKAGDYVRYAQEAGADPSLIDFGGSTDWQNEIFRNGITQDYSVSYGGGTANTSYRFSVGYTNQEGIIETSALERLTGRINATHKLLDDKLNLELNVINTQLNDTYASVTNNAGFEGNLVGAALQANPTRSPFNEDGTYAQASDWRNPLAMLGLIDDKSNTTRILANLSAEYNFTDWLYYKLNLGLDNSEAVRRTGIDPRFINTTTVDKGRAVIDNRYLNSRLMENTLTAQRPLLPRGTIDLLAGFSYQRFENRGNFLQAEYFTTTDIPLVDNVDGVDNIDNKAFTASSDRSVEELQSFFGRLNYNYDDRYLLTVNFRADGSTKFGKNNKYGYFPSAAVAWRISEEDFFSNLSTPVSDLKLRVGWGITGNQEFPGGVSLAIFRANPDGSLTQVNNPNPNIKWEETEQWNFGLDFELFDARLRGSVGYFNKSTTNLLFRKSYAQPAAVDYQWVNLDGTVLNSGVEIDLDAFVFNSSKFSWQVMYNMSFLHNKVKRLDTFVNTGQIHGQGLSGAYAERIAQGQPLYAFYMRKFEGFDENGLAKYANDGALTFVGDPLPDYTLGLTNNLAFGRFNASIFVTGSFGFQIYNNTANAIFLKGNLKNGRNVTVDVAKSSESPLNFGEVSTRFLEDGDFLRLANVSIGYNVDVSKLSPVRTLRLSLSGQNLFLITDYSGFDPEVNTDKAINEVPSLGIDYTPYPKARVVTFGIRLDI